MGDLAEVRTLIRASLPNSGLRPIAIAAASGRLTDELIATTYQRAHGGRQFVACWNWMLRGDASRS